RNCRQIPVAVTCKTPCKTFLAKLSNLTCFAIQWQVLVDKPRSMRLTSAKAQRPTRVLYDMPAQTTGEPARASLPEPHRPARPLAYIPGGSLPDRRHRRPALRGRRADIGGSRQDHGFRRL